MIELGAVGLVIIAGCALVLHLRRTEWRLQEEREGRIVAEVQLEHIERRLESVQSNYDRLRAHHDAQTDDVMQLVSNYERIQALESEPFLTKPIVGFEYLDPATFEVKGGQARSSWERLGVEAW